MRPLVVPFLDLAPAHRSLKDAILEAFSRLIDSGAFANGPAVGEFEAALADYCRTDEAVGVASGLDALRLTLQAAGLRPGDEVLVPANTFFATWEAISQAGGVPVPVDVTESDWNIDVDAAADAVTGRTAFVLPVHLYGQLADMRAVRRLADRFSLGIVEDACQAHGAARDGVSPGELSLGAAFSFYPGKNLGAMGDAGAVVTNDRDLPARLRSLREHGQAEKYVHDAIGWTSRLDTLQAIVLLHKLPLLDGWNDDRRRIATVYLDGLNEAALELPPAHPDAHHVWHLFVVQVDDPPALAAHLRQRGIATGRHYPQPPHLSRAYAKLGHAQGAFPVTERLARRCLSLPIYAGMPDERIDAVVAAVNDHVD